MGKRDSAPTYGWVFTSWLNKWIVRLCLIVSFCSVVAVSLLIARLDTDCHDTARYTMELAGYEADVLFSKTCGGVGNGG